MLKIWIRCFYEKYNSNNCLQNIFIQMYIWSFVLLQLKTLHQCRAERVNWIISSIFQVLPHSMLDKIVCLPCFPSPPPPPPSSSPQSQFVATCHIKRSERKKNQLLLENWKTQIKKSTFDWYFISSIFVANIHAHTYTHTHWRRRRRLYLCNTQGWKSIIFMLVYAFSIFQQWQYSTLFLSSTGILSEAIQYKQAGRQANFIGDFFLFNICRLYFNFVLVYIMNYNVCARVSECIECFHHHRNHRRRHRFFVSNWWEKLSKMILDQWTFQTSKHTHSHTHPVRMYINRWGWNFMHDKQTSLQNLPNKRKTLPIFSCCIFAHTLYPVTVRNTITENKYCLKTVYGVQ